MRHLAPFLVLLASGMAMPAARADVRFEITPFGGYRLGGGFEVEDEVTGKDKDVDLDSGGSWGVDLGLYRDSSSFYELLYSTQTAELDSNDPAIDGVDVTVEYYQFGGTIFFADQDWLVPYLSLTIGATRFSADGGYDSDTKFSGSLGTGLRLPFTENFAATLGLRGYLTFVNSDTNFFCVSSGDEAGCLVTSAGSSYFQGEATLGLTFRF